MLNNFNDEMKFWKFAAIEGFKKKKIIPGLFMCKKGDAPLFLF